VKMLDYGIVVCLGVTYLGRLGMGIGIGSDRMGLAFGGDPGVVCGGRERCRGRKQDE
jgi:hypothetical protein